MVRFSCGCIGFNNAPGAETKHHRLIIWSCDGDGRHESLGVYWRDMKGKKEFPLEPAVASRLIEDLGKAVADGHRFHELRMLLQIRN